MAPVGDYYLYALDPEGLHTAGFFGAPTVVSVTDGGSAVADPVLPATTGAVAGTITEEGSGDPIAGSVFLGIDAATGRFDRGAVSEATGGYVADGIAPGDHLGVFVDLSGGHAVEYHDDRPGPQGATPIGVTAGATSGGIDAALPARAAPGGAGHLVGTVSDAVGGAALEGVVVIALRADDYSFAAGDLTDVDGGYDIGVDLAGHKLLFYDPSAAREAEWWNNVGFDQIGASETVTPTASTPTRRRDASLAPTAGVVTGLVTDAVCSTPVEGAWAVVIHPTDGLRAAVTGPDGTYAVDGVPAGTTLATFVDPSGVHLQEYWDDHPTAAGASTLAVTAGDTVTGVDAALTSAADC